MDRNLWLAVALSFGVYAVWVSFFEKPVAPRPAATAAATVPGVSAAPAASAPAAAAPAPAEAPPPQFDAKGLLSRSDAAGLDGSEALVSPWGAGLDSFVYPGPHGEKIQLVADPLHPLFTTWPGLLFRRDPSVKDGAAYEAVRSDGLRVEKEFLPGVGKVLPRIVVTVRNPTRRALDVGPWTLTVGPGLGTTAGEQKENKKLTRVIALTPKGGGLRGRVETLKPGAHDGPYRWVAVDNRYFLAALLPPEGTFGPALSAAPPALTLTAEPVTLKAGQSAAWTIPYYLGPKGQTGLAAYGVGLERAIDFGFFATIGRWMLEALVRLHGLTGNWGWAIITLTLLLQIFLMPLTWKSLKAAASMRKLQPEITKLQQRYKDDPTKLNTEMMALYKKGGANPLGGCLPMLMQMPIFVALYNALRSSWELHGAAWAFWIHDLSAKDPYYILPIVMGALMFAQSKLNPPVADPTQQQMMMFMPIIFTVMFLNFPSGLVLYWLTNSLVSTLLQLALKDRLQAA
ncbi:MAG: membrane protein insertase YidC [Elusimicrobia bacterium]|nr:membrane protein insertase YidC [Elusimicrobiota bacterium]